jgi:hypothetical protein
MSAQGPSNPPLGDRARMAEALASLKEGLRDTADPLYDGWKLRPRAPAGSEPQKPAPQAPPRPAPSAPKAAALAEAGETIDISVEETPDGTPAAAAAPSIAPLVSDAEPATPLDDWFDDGAVTQDPLIEVVDEEEEPLPATGRRQSVQTDTVRVRIVRYQHFPRWALVIAAALVLFALSALVLRASVFPRSATHAAQAVLTVETPRSSPVITSERGPGAPSVSEEAALRAVPAPARPRAANAPSAESAPAAAALVPDPLRASNNPPPATASSSNTAVKVPPSPKRRPGGHDFFRDPGF